MMSTNLTKHNMYKTYKYYIMSKHYANTPDVRLSTCLHLVICKSVTVVCALVTRFG